MPLGTRVLLVDYANLLAGDRSTTNPAISATEKNAIANEVYQWLHLALTPRVSYLTQAGFTHADGTTVAADSGLVLATQGGSTFDTTLTNIEELFSVHFEGLAGADPGTIESVPRMEYLEWGEFRSVKASLADATAPRFVHWERLATDTVVGSSVGKWRIHVAPGKSQTSGAGSWYLSVVCRRALSSPDTDLSTTSPLSADGSTLDLLPHETYLCARFLAYEIMMKSGCDPKWTKRLMRNIPGYLVKSFRAARGLGEMSVAP